ncbi:hypothetical protein F0063_05945 [Salmonella enterica]|nr:hypothetical protein [Salmonella enterica]EEA8248083.1 hypothetical protein [Salmonella enterica]
MKIHLLFTLLMGSAVSQYALADVCKNVNGVPSRVNYDLTTILPRKIAAYFRDVRRYNIKIIRMPDEIIFRTLPVYAYLATNGTRYKNAKKLISTLQSTFLFRPDEQSDTLAEDSTSLCRL